ncbi:MAG: DnaJ domain-containing protein [Candidatus Aenigmatarchaeota archaeon]
MQKDYYKILGIDKNATEEEIKKAYKRLAKKYHPDVSKEPDAEEKFKEIQEAYDTLIDPVKRRQYDNMGSYFGERYWGGNAKGDEEFIFGNDIFNEFIRKSMDFDFDFIFGKRGGSSGNFYKKHRININMSLHELWNGTVLDLRNFGINKQLEIPKQTVPNTILRLELSKSDILEIVLIAQDYKNFLFDSGRLFYIIEAPFYMKYVDYIYDIEHLDGTSFNVKINKTTENEITKVIKGKGFKGADLFVKVFYTIPNYLTEEQEELMKQIAHLDVRFNKIKNKD